MRFLSKARFPAGLKGPGVAAGALLYDDGDQMAALEAGSAGRVVTSNGLALAPTYEVPTGGGSGGLDPTITSLVGGTSGALDFRNAADYEVGDGVSFRDADYRLWDYVLRAGVLPGASTAVNTGTDTVADLSADMIALAIGDRVSFVTTGTLPAPLTQHTAYYVRSKPTAGSMTLSTTLGGALLDITSAGTGTLYWVRHDSPHRVIPKDYNPATNAYYWQYTQTPWRIFHMPFLAFSGSASVSNVLLQRGTYAYDILGWGVSCQTPVATPGSGGAISFTADLRKTGASNNTIVATALLPALSLGAGVYSNHYTATKPEAIASVAAGEALYLAVSVAGSIAPAGVEVHLVCRVPSPFPG